MFKYKQNSFGLSAFVLKGEKNNDIYEKYKTDDDITDKMSSVSDGYLTKTINVIL